MRTRLSAGAAAVVTVAVLLSISAGAQIPALPPAAAFEEAEVRGLRETPASPDAGFGSGEKGPVFAEGTRAVVARFSSASPPADESLSIQWVLGSRRGEPRVLSRTRLDRGELAGGVHSILTNNGEALAPGDYQVSVVGAGNRVYRALEFEVRGAPRAARPPARQPAGPSAAQPAQPPSASAEPAVPLAEHTIEEISFAYPASYAASTLQLAGESGSVFVDSRTRAFLFVTVKKGGRFAFERDGVALRTALGRATQQFSNVGSWRSYTLSKADLPARATAGKLFIAPTDAGSHRIVMHVLDVDGTRVVAGYYVAGGAAAPGRSSSGDERIIGDFYALVRSLRSTGPEPVDEERPEPARERPASRGEVAD